MRSSLRFRCCSLLGLLLLNIAPVSASLLAFCISLCSTEFPLAMAWNSARRFCMRQQRSCPSQECSCLTLAWYVCCSSRCSICSGTAAGSFFFANLQWDLLYRSIFCLSHVKLSQHCVAAHRTKSEYFLTILLCHTMKLVFEVLDLWRLFSLLCLTSSQQFYFIYPVFSYCLCVLYIADVVHLDRPQSAYPDVPRLVQCSRLFIYS